ncbi:hypothetical protein [Burkholderia alba]|nr:hypothetical protein [Burkholderia alba]
MLETLREQRGADPVDEKKGCMNCSPLEDVRNADVPRSPWISDG